MTLRRYTNQLGFPVFSVDYRLAPEHWYPKGLSDCWQAYLWILKYSRKYLGLKFSKILLTGDSAGGNLLLGVTNLCILKGVRAPDGIHPLYTPVACAHSSFTPSTCNQIDDDFVNSSFLNLCLGYYLDEFADPEVDCFISPICTPKLLLE